MHDQQTDTSNNRRPSSFATHRQGVLSAFLLVEAALGQSYAIVLGGLSQILEFLIHWLEQSSKVLVGSWKLQGAILDNNLGEFLGANLEGSRKFLGEFLGCCLGVS